MRIFFLTALLLYTAPVLAGDPVWNYDAEDPVMNQAIADARATLPLFYRKMETTDLRNEVMLLKVAFPYGNDGAEEHIWVELIDRRGDLFVGILSNAPVYINYRQYDPVSFEEADISDWLYWREDGLMEGAFTIRAMLPDLAPEEAASLGASLAPLPQVP